MRLMAGLLGAALLEEPVPNRRLWPLARTALGWLGRGGWGSGGWAVRRPGSPQVQGVDGPSSERVKWLVLGEASPGVAWTH